MDELANLLKDMVKDQINGDRAILELVEKLIAEHVEMKLTISSLSQSVSIHSELLRIMIDAASLVANEHSNKDVH